MTDDTSAQTSARAKVPAASGSVSSGTTVPSPVKISARAVSAWFGERHVLRSIDLDFPEKRVAAIIGPSGCGKSTFIRCLNRMHEMIPGARMDGRIELDGQNIYDRSMDAVDLRRRVGMVFQKPNPFPTMSVRENVLAGLTLTNRLDPKQATEVVERSLRQAALWDEVKDILDKPGVGLSGGQQQRLCIARAIAVDPEVILMDEPCSALDPIATARIEDLIHELRLRYTVVIVTHNMQQATRVSDRTAFFLSGDLVEYGETDQVFTAPRDQRTEDYITGKFG